ncbi:DUF2946 domain-containing protein [Hydrogenophaga sp. NH-16]|uniref:DUF2946 domain-containing protein n=1 Tax=Hydrogenophaga sp. NH-16 TaxID=2184519 RepID=UPI000FD8CB4B|nr:DUF2946 domain-containing protein [Hydrogenophaga sp. NH-16]
MSFLRLRRRFAAWLALVAMLLGALAPTIAQARMGGSDRADWLEICTTTGMVWVQPDTGELAQKIDGQPAGSDASPHCPWCTLHGGASGLPPVEAVAMLPAPLAEQPSAFYRAPLTDTVWATARSRAPPLSL